MIPARIYEKDEVKLLIIQELFWQISYFSKQVVYKQGKDELLAISPRFSRPCSAAQAPDFLK